MAKEILVEYSTDGGSTWTEVNNAGTRLRRGNGNNQLAPQLEFGLQRDAPISSGDLVRAKIDGTREFEGVATTSGRYQPDGSTAYEIRGNGYEVMEAQVTLDLTGTSPENVLSQAFSGTSYSVTTSTATGVTLDYSCTDKKRKNVVRDMLDRTSYRIRITPNQTINFEPAGDRGSYGSLDTSTDDVMVDNSRPGEIDTVVNKVTVKGTQGNYSGTASDSTSISTYGERSKTYNFRYLSSDSEASSIATELLNPDPLDEVEIRLHTADYDQTNLVNYEVTLTDAASGFSSSTFVVNYQEVRPGLVIIKMGEESSSNLARAYRENKSADEKNEAGATSNQTFFDTALSNISGQEEGDIAVIDQTGDGTYDEIYTYDGSSWQQGGTRSDIDATQNVDYVVSDISNISSPQNGDIAIETGTEDFDQVYMYSGGSWTKGGTIGGQLFNNILDESGSAITDDLITSSHINVVRGGNYSVNFPTIDTTYSNNTGQDLLVLSSIDLNADSAGDALGVEFKIDDGSGFTIHGEAYIDDSAGSGSDVRIVGGIVPNGQDWKITRTGTAGTVTIPYEHRGGMKTQ